MRMDADVKEGVARSDHMHVDIPIFIFLSVSNEYN